MSIPSLKLEARLKLCLLLAATSAFVLIAHSSLRQVEARAMRKPPFNGSIFGKRSVGLPLAPPDELIANLPAPAAQIQAGQPLAEALRESLLEEATRQCLLASDTAQRLPPGETNQLDDALCVGLLDELRRLSAPQAAALFRKSISRSGQQTY